MAIDLLACTGDACRAGNLRALRCINHPATAYLHCMKPLRKSLLPGQFNRAWLLLRIFEQLRLTTLLTQTVLI
jgi:hypothetical protein